MMSGRVERGYYTNAELEGVYQARAMRFSASWESCDFGPLEICAFTYQEVFRTMRSL